MGEGDFEGVLVTGDDPDALTNEELTDEELTALALAADPAAPLDAKAIPLTNLDARSLGLLPSWYMPAIALGRAQGYWKVVVLVLVATLIGIEVAGLCSTYGQLVAP
jgi:hypothetical protein